ncbi:PREDICTED: NFX1-type zinc finger-containing protein 1 [Cyprinodon variegatus]|uniref:Zinc finger, NFX1-type containing 1 n=1 Tax=Cyprinodon variegatus TaxID=28743 RepID=A0A3Q2DNG7_CYPVA|nr:PREDICTED: NFX1-type zinc finger-containing protein 1 [Cyprinodon variegatus]XP_015239631.1 PREDICTED: NFX1-type zinc finger-containing protein 1 [Cyprinodon variegatus]XP_015239632.1 PREDICTED: NFX1-type zinc finger-containing protein 1 [Cyprinodon variegatus]XP_015239633.1 PREDICTED: NFX1-type zinc finger-containing protein 1 [Cyprinodon variegatus]XP_015239634.1 PREDICTED: NFX1-type zinc finger-containing protein 1 [Cyprinodon variegatus]
MERLTSRSGRRGPLNDIDTGQHGSGYGQRGPRRGGLQGDGTSEQGVRRRAQSQGNSQRDSDRQRGGRGGHRGRGADRQRFGGGRNEHPGGAEKQGGGAAGIGIRRGAPNGDRREGGDEKKDGAGPRKMGYKTLEELSQQEPSVVAITLSSKPGFQLLLSETPMRPDLIQLVCLALCKAFSSRTDRGTLQHLADIIKDSKFLGTTLLHYVGGMMSDSNPNRRAQYPHHLENILAILSEVVSIFPASSVSTVNMLVTMLQASINTLRASGIDFPPKVEEKMENLKGLIEHLQERSRKGTLRTDKDSYSLLTNADDNQGEAQDDFRNIPLYPTPEEFQQDHRPFLRPNITSQRYTNTHLYLDTHFRLLREDFVRPLRMGIQQLLQNQMDAGRNDNPAKMRRFDDIRVYYDTHLVVPKCTQTGLAYIVQFDAEPLKFVRWQNSKRLLFGSLVCLSYDNFESFLFATVSDRDPKDLEKGQVQITFTEESRLKLPRIQTDQLFLMVETTAYFEAYRYVLEGLKEQTEEDLPFQRYIVECSTDVQPPAYLRRNDVYDLSPVANPEHKSSIKPFKSLDPEAWPDMEELGLDVSQMKAFQLALTKELAIIQGPPGTGKTYVGLKIAQALLTNQELWNSINPAPVLVVCYTNHALDQFLEGIHKFLKDGIVRVGGRSNSEILKQFNLRELTHSQNFRRTLPPHLRTAYNQIYRQLCEEERAIQSQGMRLECSLKGVMRETFLQRFILDTHWDSLKCLPMECSTENWNRKNTSLIMEWLGLGSTNFQQREPETANENQEEEAMEEEDELIEIAEEAELIQAERMIDDGWTIGPRAGRDDKKKENLEDGVREMEELMLVMNLDNVDVRAEQSGEAWQMQRDQRKKMKHKIRKEIGKSSAMTEEEESHVFDVWSLNLKDRWRLYRLWVTRYRIELRTKALESEQAYQNAVDRLADVKRQENLHVLKKATVIGMTTTGAAKFRKALQEVRPCLVIVEEAAEVLEAHTITTLSKACQHLILIGDHQQLRPSATVYELAKNFSLEMSMFERLVNMGLPYVRLNYQHRMRPDIACLLTPHIYSELENHPSVYEYENIKGLNTNLFFLEHNHLEEEIKDGRSHQNSHEAKFVVALCRYLLLQDYKPEQITILTTYTGQLHCLRKQMPASDFSGVKVHVVDKYQGEENDIILLSLVRSNRQGKVGFLNIPNRVCVALSRAKKGLYCIGNSEILSRVELWSNIFHTLREKEQVGKALTLCCQNHPNRQVKASSAEDFKQAPEGGCTQPCQFRLDCGHVCPRVCHPYDPKHKEFNCTKKCEKILCIHGHKCTRLCHQTCPTKCPVKVEKIIPQCHHTQMVPCHQEPDTFICQDPCQKLLPCGHPCDSVCGKPCSTKCTVPVILKLSCGHNQQGACFQKTGTEQPECRASCKHELKCGHGCRGTCSKCNQGRFHTPCARRCERLLICSHKCMEPCTRDCPTCQRPCENCCVHSNCMRECGQPCAPCVEPCAWQCPHQRCSKLCHEPCDRPPCTQPCKETLKCGHPCIGLCGDKCPSKCRICHYEDVSEIFFGTEDDPEARFIQLEDCGHIFESTAMDQWMSDINQGPEEGQVAIKLKECPRCKTPIRKNLRYGSLINRSLAEIEMVKRKINGRQSDIEEKRASLKNHWLENHTIADMYVQEEYRDIQEKLEKNYLTSSDLWVLENKIDFLIRVAKLLKVEREKMLFTDGYRFRQRVKQFMPWLNNTNQKFTDQQVFDLQRELQRLTLLAELNGRCHVADTKGQMSKMQSEVQEIRHALEMDGQFTEQDQLNVKEAMKSLDKKFPVTGLGISEEERKMIVSAMKMPPGHWHKCPNGHVYVITECGGANQRSNCPDCKASIGGENHRLDSGNQVATEMDGSRYSAWSEANNLRNFDPLDI